MARSNIGERLAAALALTTAARQCEETEGLPFKFTPLSIGKISEQAELIEEAALGAALVHIAGLVFEIAGKRPDSVSIEPALDRVRKILALKKWPEDAADYALQIADDQIPEPDTFTEIFGFETAPDEIVREVMICHGCPDEKVPGTETDPRGFPGKLCANCAAGARLDLSTGHAELGPDATDEARAKAAEVERAYVEAHPDRRCQQETPGAVGTCRRAIGHPGACVWDADLGAAP